MTLSAVSNKTWLNVEVILNSSNRVVCRIASAGTAVHGSIQLNGNSIGIRNDWNVRGSHTQTSRGTGRIGKGREQDYRIAVSHDDFTRRPRVITRHMSGANQLGLRPR